MAMTRLSPDAVAAGQPGDGPVQRGRLFDGQSSHGRQAVVRMENQDLVLTPAAEAPAVPGPAGSPAGDGQPSTASAPPLRYPLWALTLGERWQQGPYAVGLPNGGTLWLEQQGPSTAAFVQVLMREAGQPRRVARLWQSWPAALACLVLLVAVVVWFDRQGAGLAARTVLPWVPLSFDDKVGKRVMGQLDKNYFARSAHAVDYTELWRRFHEMTQLCGQGRTFNLELRRLRNGPGFNAFALPDGTVVILDGLLDALTHDEALAVLAHEIGHVVDRHGMQHVFKSIGLLTVAATVFSDFSSVLATTVGTVQSFRHSREAEREADAYARTCIARMGIDPRVMVGLWKKFQAEREQGGNAMPPPWLSTHPGLEERLREAQQH